jgi:cytochrome c2
MLNGASIKASALEGYAFSDTMKNANRTRDEATLDAYLADPRKDIPGGKMIFAGLPDADARQNVIA